MILKNSFFYKEPDFFKINRSKFIVGLIIGFFYALAMYSLFYLTRECFRIFSITENFDLWVLTDEAVNFYNLFFAFIAVIFGQSICFSFWLDRPKKIFGEQSLRKTTIVNDQRVLNWFFLSWFSKVAILYGIFFGDVFKGGFYVFSFYPDYIYLFVLFMVVLFLQTWNTIRLVNKRKSLKWMIVSFVIVSVLSFAFSKINLINYKAINAKILSKNIYHKYRLKIPEAECYERLDQLSLVKRIYMVMPKGEDVEGAEPIIIFGKQEIKLEELPAKVEHWRTNRIPSFLQNKTVCQLYIHEAVKMKYVNQLNDELSKLGFNKIGYAIVPANPKYDKRYYQDYIFILKNLIADFELSIFKEFYQEFFESPDNIILTQNANGGYLVSNSPVEPEDLKNVLKDLILQQSDGSIVFYNNEEADFKSYFYILSNYKDALYDLRNNYAKMNYAQQYFELESSEKWKVDNKFPYKLFEVTEEMLGKIKKAAPKRKRPF